MTPMFLVYCWFKGHDWSRWDEGLEGVQTQVMFHTYRMCWKCGKVESVRRTKDEV